MSRRTVVLKTCDICAAEPGRTEPVEAVRSVTIEVEGRRPHLLDVCEPHGEQMEQTWELGVDVSMVLPPSRAYGTHRTRQHDPTVPVEYRTCPLCPHVAKSRGGLGQHLRHDHQLNITDLVRQGKMKFMPNLRGQYAKISDEIEAARS